jgi:hypothetical protein
VVSLAEVQTDSLRRPLLLGSMPTTGAASARQARGHRPPDRRGSAALLVVASSQGRGPRARGVHGRSAIRGRARKRLYPRQASRSHEAAPPRLGGVGHRGRWLALVATSAAKIPLPRRRASLRFLIHPCADDIGVNHPPIRRRVIFDSGELNGLTRRKSRLRVDHHIRRRSHSPWKVFQHLRE